MRARSLLSLSQREFAVDYFEQGYGSGATANRLQVPRSRVRKLYGHPNFILKCNTDWLLESLAVVGRLRWGFSTRGIYGVGC